MQELKPGITELYRNINAIECSFMDSRGKMNQKQLRRKFK